MFNILITFQAALAPIVLSHVTDTASEEYAYAKKIITLCILSIMITTTIGAALVTLLGSRLLRKTKFAVEPEQWRRSHRPSVRDISIIDEDEEEDEEDSEAREVKRRDELSPEDANAIQFECVKSIDACPDPDTDTLTDKLRKTDAITDRQKNAKNTLDATGINLEKASDDVT